MQFQLLRGDVGNSSADPYFRNVDYQQVKKETITFQGKTYKGCLYQRQHADFKWRLSKILEIFFTALASIKEGVLTNRVYDLWQQVKTGKEIKTVFLLEEADRVVQTTNDQVISRLDRELRKGEGQLCIDFSQSHEVKVLDEDMKWNKDVAPDLFENVKMADGTPLDIQPGDYVVPVKAFNAKQFNKSSQTLVKNWFYLPGSLIRSLHPGDILPLQFKNQRIDFKIEDHDGSELRKNNKFREVVETIESQCYPLEGRGRSSKHVSLEKIKNLAELKVYVGPARKVLMAEQKIQEDAQSRLCIEKMHNLKWGANHKTYYRFDSNVKEFAVSTSPNKYFSSNSLLNAHENALKASTYTKQDNIVVNVSLDQFSTIQLVDDTFNFSKVYQISNVRFYNNEIVIDMPDVTESMILSIFDNTLVCIRKRIPEPLKTDSTRIIDEIFPPNTPQYRIEVAIIDLKMLGDSSLTATVVKKARLENGVLKISFHNTK